MQKNNVLQAVRAQLREDLTNGNLEHTFNPEVVDIDRFIDNFITCVQERMRT